MNATMRKQIKSKISLLLVFVMLMGLLLPLGSVFSQGLEGQDATVTDQVYKERGQPVTVATHVYDGNNKGSALEITLNLVGDSVPVVGQPVTVAAQVYNTGTSSLIALNVPLYLEDVAEPIGTEVIEELGSGAAETVSFLWTPAAAGFHNLRVVVEGGYGATLIVEVLANNLLLQSLSQPNPHSEFSYELSADHTATVSAFSGSGEVVIPKEITVGETDYTVVAIKNNVFSGNQNITSVIIPDSVTTVGTNLFKDCLGLKSVTLPIALTEIPQGMFDGCRQLTDIQIPAGVTTIGNRAFDGCSGLTAIEIPAGVTSIGDRAFGGCSGLTAIEIPAGVTSIGTYAFSGCSGLTAIKIPAGVTSIGTYAFSGCTGLTSIEISDGVTSIGAMGFRYCSGLTTIEIPASVTSIGANTFQGCTNLTTIFFHGTMPSLGNNALPSGSSIYYHLSNQASWNSFSSTKKPFVYLTLDLGYDSKVSNAYGIITEESLISSPSIPIRPGYTFGGWYKDEDWENRFDFDHQRVENDLTLYAKWTEGTGILHTLQLSGSPVLIFEDKDFTFDLEGLTLEGRDAEGAANDLTAMDVEWRMVSGPATLETGSSVLTITGVGTIVLQASIGEVQSNELEFPVLTQSLPQQLQELILSGSLPLIYTGENLAINPNLFLTLEGRDTEGKEYSLTGKKTTWSVVSGPAWLNGSIIIITDVGKIGIQAEIEGVKSNVRILVASSPLPQPTTVEERIAGIASYLLNLNADGEDEKPHLAMSLYPFALKASGIDLNQFDLTTTDTTYNYQYRLSGDDYQSNKWIDTLSLADKIFDQIAQGKDAISDVEELLARQKDNGWFKDLETIQASRQHATAQSRAILAIDAYYGVDYDEEWPNYVEGAAKGRVGAVSALLKDQWPTGSSSDTGGFTSAPFRSESLSGGGDFTYSRSLPYGACDALIALSNYTNHPAIIDENTQATLGKMVRDAIDLALDQLEIRLSKNNFFSGYFAIPALVAIGETERIERYGLLSPGISNKWQTNGSYKNHDNTTNLGVEYDTQQVLIALSDLLEGEAAWKRIITPRAQNVKDVLADRDALDLTNAVTETIKLDLASVGPYGSTVKWYSHQPDVIDHEGMVTLPEAGRKRVTLTATISKGEIEKTRDFVITVDSQLKTRNQLMLEKAVNAIGETYGVDLSNAGFKGAFALAATGLNLAEYSFYDVTGHKQGDLSQYSPQDYAEIILQLVLTGKNPYNHQGMNYVAELQALEKQGNFGSMKDNIWALLALDAAGGTYDADLINLIAEGIDENTPLATLGQALCGLATHRGLKAVDTAIEQAVARLESCQITEGPLAGMFFEDDEQYDFNLHAIITSGLTAVGEDLRENTENSTKWTQSGQTPLDIFELYQLEEGTFKTDLTDTIGAINFDAVIALADMAADSNVWSQAYLSPTDFQNLLTRAKTLIDQVLDLYTPQSGLALRNAYQEAVAANVPPGTIKGYGEKYFDLLTAINGLSMEFLPIFEDEGMYTPESFEKFKTKVTELYKTLSSEKATTEEVAEACGAVVEAYENLESVAAVFSSAFFSQGATFPEPMAAMATTTATTRVTTTATTDTQKQAQALLDKTMAAYHEYYGFDHSNGNYWRVFELASAGMDLAQYEFFDVTTHKNGLFNTYQATDYAAIILQLILTGNNPYDYEGINYVERLQAIDKDNTGIFGPWANHIWALMALDAAGAAYHPRLVTTVKNQAAAPNFTLDMRGWALAAIQNHKDVISDEEMQAITRSFQDRQLQEGPLRSLFISSDLGQNIMTHGCAVSGLVAAGVDLSAPEWSKDGQNPLDILALYQREDGQIYYALDVINNDTFEGKFPGFNKDAIIALGDIVQGSNVWQRLALKPGHINDVLREAKDLLEGDLSIYTAASVNALQVAYANAVTIPSGKAKGYGDRYYRLVAAIKGLDSNLIPAFTDQAKYTAGSFASFKTAVMDTRKLLEQSSTTALAVSQACETVGLAFKNLSTGSGDNPTNPDNPANPDNPTDPTKPGDNITVTFTLLGGDAHGGSNGPVYIYKKNPGAFEKWVPRTSVTVAADSTVYDVFTKVLKDNGYTYVGAESNYVSSIQTPGGLTLSEFSNGPKSGWMYIVNGTHPNVGLRNYVLRNGDNIIWHYTDDFTQEEGSEKWGGGGGTVATPEKPIEEIPIIEGQAEIDLEKGETVRISAQDVLKLAENDFLTIFKEGIKVEVPMTNLITDAFKMLAEETKALLEVTIKELTAAEKQEVLDKGKLAEDRGIFDIDGRIYDITLSIITADAGGNETRTKLIAYHQPVIITLDLSELNVSEEDISQLTAVRYEVDEQDAIKVVKLGGEYDAETKLLRFYTNTLSYYGVAKARHLTKIQLAIDSLDAQVNGESIPLAQPATIINDRTMVPLRFIAEAMTAEVKWDGEEKKVTIIDQSQNKTLILYVDQIHPELDTPPVIINGRTMVPIRYIAEQLGAYVLWHPDSQQIDIVR